MTRLVPIALLLGCLAVAGCARGTRPPSAVAVPAPADVRNDVAATSSPDSSADGFAPIPEWGTRPGSARALAGTDPGLGVATSRPSFAAVAATGVTDPIDLSQTLYESLKRWPILTSAPPPVPADGLQLVFFESGGYPDVSDLLAATAPQQARNLRRSRLRKVRLVPNVPTDDAELTLTLFDPHWAIRYDAAADDRRYRFLRFQLDELLVLP